jgi:hypothetical protein
MRTYLKRETVDGKKHLKPAGSMADTSSFDLKGAE